ncbi:MAG TPA: PHP domain-containing protein [Gemmatimonadota bacterium]|nr:PHP domain-containing protein [Gemmatimonadota bacterium]
MSREPEGARVDLHLHSTASDGTEAPASVVRRAADAGLAGVALADHDTVGGLEEAAREASRLGLRFLAGSELSANEPGRSVHLLAYGFDPEDEGLRAYLEGYREERVRRAREIVRRLRELGVDLPYEEVERRAVGGNPTRAHIGRALVEEGLVKDERTAFGRYLSRGRPAFVEKRPSPPADVIARAHAAGGVVLVAHPGREHSMEDIERWLGEGLDGVEVLHPSHDEAMRARLGALVRDRGLLAGGGSDWHGRGDMHEAVPGSQDVPLTWMDAIEERSGTSRVSTRD